MNKFIRTDIKEGIGSLKVGIHNLIKEIEDNNELELHVPINRFILVGILQELNYQILHDVAGIIINADVLIRVIWKDKEAKFYVENE